MDWVQVLHMNGGKGDTSYAKNSTLQRKIISFGNQVIEEAIEDILLRKNALNLGGGSDSGESMGIADLGCSSGPNTLILVSEIIQIVHSTVTKIGKPMPELRVSLNDLPGNDFNDIFISLPAFYQNLQEQIGFFGGFQNRCFISAVAASFYGRLFARNTLHLLHSSSSLHWLSQVPPSLQPDAREPMNKGKIYISKSSPESVSKAYLAQFQKDFSVFLKCRAEEMVSGGHMILSFLGRSSADPTTKDSCYQWELLAQTLMTMASEGLISEEKIDSFNAPYYAPSVEEVKTAFEEEGSFVIDGLNAFEIEWNAGCQSDFTCESGGEEAQDGFCKREKSTRGQRFAKTIRAVVESMLESHFGGEINMDQLQEKYGDLVDEYFSKASPKYINLVISAIRN